MDEKKWQRNFVRTVLAIIAALAVALVALVFLGVYALADLVF